MKPTNSKERRVSFLKFLALFIATVVSIQAAVFFNYSVPKKENALLRQSNMETEIERDFQKNFFAEMRGLKGLIDSMDIEGQNISYQKSLISGKIVDLQKKIPPKDSTYLYDMHMDVIQLYVELQTAKEKLLGLKDAESTIDEYKTAFKDCQENVKQLERELYIERRSN